MIDFFFFIFFGGKKVYFFSKPLQMPPKHVSDGSLIPDRKTNWPPRLLMFPVSGANSLLVYYPEIQDYRVEFPINWSEAKVFMEENKSPIYKYIGDKDLTDLVKGKAKFESFKLKPQDFRKISVDEFYGRETDPDPATQATQESTDEAMNWPPRLIYKPFDNIFYQYDPKTQEYELTLIKNLEEAKQRSKIWFGGVPIVYYIGKKHKFSEIMKGRKLNTELVGPEDFREVTEVIEEGKEVPINPKLKAMAEQVPMKQQTNTAEKTGKTKNWLPRLLFDPDHHKVYDYDPTWDEYVESVDCNTWEDVKELMEVYKSPLYRYRGERWKFNNIIKGKITSVVKPGDFQEVTQAEFERQPVHSEPKKPGQVLLKQQTNVVAKPVGEEKNQVKPVANIGGVQYETGARREPKLLPVEIPDDLNEVSPELNSLFRKAVISFNDIISRPKSDTKTKIAYSDFMRFLGRKPLQYGEMMNVLNHKCARTSQDVVRTSQLSNDALDYYFELLKYKSQILGNARVLSNYSVYKSYAPMVYISSTAGTELAQNRRNNDSEKKPPGYVHKEEFLYLDVGVEPRTVFLFPILLDILDPDTKERIGGHWVLYAWKLNNPGTLYYFNSLIPGGEPNKAKIYREFMDYIGQYLVINPDLVSAPRAVVQNSTEWIPNHSTYMKTVVVKTQKAIGTNPGHQQFGGYDCGYYVCWFAETIIDNVFCLIEDFGKYNPRDKLQGYQRYMSVSMMAGYCVGNYFSEMQRDTLGIATAAPPLLPPPPASTPPAASSVEPSGAPAPLPLAVPPDEGSSQPLSKEVRYEYKWLYGAPPVDDDDSEEDDEGSSQPIPEDVRKEYYGYLDDDIELPAPEGPAPVPVGSPPTLEEDDATAIKFPPMLKEDKYLPSAPPLPQSEEDDIVYPLTDDDETPPPTKPKHPKHPKHSKHSKHSKHLPDDEYDMNDGFIVDESPEEGQKALEELHEYMMQDSKAREARNKGEPLPPAPPPPPSPKAAAAAEAAAAKAKKKRIVPTAEKKRIPPTLITDGKTVVQPAFAQVYGIKTPAGPPRTKKRERGPTLERRREALDKMFPGSIEAAENLIERRKPDLTAAQPPKKKQKQPPPPPPPPPQPQSSEQEPVLDAAFFRSLM